MLDPAEALRVILESGPVPASVVNAWSNGTRTAYLALMDDQLDALGPTRFAERREDLRVLWEAVRPPEAAAAGPRGLRGQDGKDPLESPEDTETTGRPGDGPAPSEDRPQG